MAETAAAPRHGHGLIEIDEARRLVLGHADRLEAEPVALADSVGRVLAVPANSDDDVPAFDNSAMDGFAVRAADTAGASPDSPVELRHSGESAAGSPATAGVEPGEAIEISTGAMMPEGADAVLRSEDADTEYDGGDGVVRVHAVVEPGLFIRRAGEDIAAGSTVIEPGTPIGPAEAGVLASIGLAEVSCTRRPRVAVLTTGDELREPGEALGPGEVRNSNAISVPALARAAGAEVIGVETVADDGAATEEALHRAMAADVAVVCGGVSVGRHDHVRPALERLGAAEVFWGVALRPGKPTWFGTAPGGGLVFGVPGNPVSTMICFHVFARLAIRAMLGAGDRDRSASAILEADLPAVPGRAHLARCSLELRDDGWHAHPAPAQGSHVLTSMLGADAIAILPSEDSGARAGDRVAIELLEAGL